MGVCTPWHVCGRVHAMTCVWGVYTTTHVWSVYTMARVWRVHAMAHVWESACHDMLCGVCIPWHVCVRECMP